MTVKHHEFLVEYVDEPEATPRVVPVRVIMADRLNVEMRGKRYGLADPKQQPQLLGFLWLYFAMIRQGDIPETMTFEEFQAHALDNQIVDEAGVEVPPTRPERFGDSVSGSPSPSRPLIGLPSSPPETTS